MGFNRNKEEKSVKKKKKKIENKRGLPALGMAESIGESDGSGFQRVCGFLACGGFRLVNLPKMVKRTRRREVETLWKARDRDGRRRLGWPKRSARVGFTWGSTGFFPSFIFLFFFFFFSLR